MNWFQLLWALILSRIIIETTMCCELQCVSYEKKVQNFKICHRSIAHIPIFTSHQMTFNGDARARGCWRKFLHCKHTFIAFIPHLRFFLTNISLLFCTNVESNEHIILHLSCLTIFFKNMFTFDTEQMGLSLFIIIHEWFNLKIFL